MKRISKILIANRGEIACRIIRTCKRLGIKTVAIYSTADKGALHTRNADEAYCVGAAETTSSYLNITSIISIAKSSHCDAVHPGYGFLSENAAFVDALTAEGIQFIGPTSSAMRALGDKIKAKEIAKKAKVPFAPWLRGNIETKDFDAQLTEFLKTIQFPLIVKAAGGGGGRGMRIVADSSSLSDALQSASREALKFFGNAEVYCEKLIANARHIEVQIIGDQNGNVSHLFDRDCSMQRNHQKVIEEAPAPGIPDTVRNSMHAAAIALGKAVSYSNLGTVEFLLDRENNFYFLEVNSRLQVEHPVTEEILGLDLVELQIKVAEGEKLEQLLPQKITPQGHALECRLCAESPENGFIASTGMIRSFSVPSSIFPDTRTRLESGFHSGDKINHYYDSMLAKVIIQAPTRQQAILAMKETLTKSVLSGISTNISYLQTLLSSPEFTATTHHITFASKLIPNKMQIEQDNALAASVATCSLINSSVTDNPWQSLVAWNQTSSRKLAQSFTIGGQRYDASLCIESPTAFKVDVRVSNENFKYNIEKANLDSQPAQLIINGTRYFCSMLSNLHTHWLCINGASFILEPVKSLGRKFQHGQSESNASVGSPLPGKIIAIKVKVGDSVLENQVLITIESMKMEHSIRAPQASVIKEIHVQLNSAVQSGQTLITLD